MKHTETLRRWWKRNDIVLVMLFALFGVPLLAHSLARHLG